LLAITACYLAHSVCQFDHPRVAHGGGHRMPETHEFISPVRSACGVVVVAEDRGARLRFAGDPALTSNNWCVVVGSNGNLNHGNFRSRSRLSGAIG